METILTLLLLALPAAIVRTTLAVQIHEWIFLSRSGVRCTAGVVDLERAESSSRGGQSWQLVVELQWRGEIRRVRTQSGWFLTPFGERRRVRRKLDRWCGRNVQFLYHPALPSIVRRRPPQEVAVVRRMIWKDVLLWLFVLSLTLLILLAALTPLERR